MTNEFYAVKERKERNKNIEQSFSHNLGRWGGDGVILFRSYNVNQTDGKLTVTLIDVKIRPSTLIIRNWFNHRR